MVKMNYYIFFRFFPRIYFRLKHFDINYCHITWTYTLWADYFFFFFFDFWPVPREVFPNGASQPAS